MAGVSNTDGMKIEAAGACFKFVVYAMCHVEKGGLSEQGKTSLWEFACTPDHISQFDGQTDHKLHGIVLASSSAAVSRAHAR
jgi:hypothetical protein